MSHVPKSGQTEQSIAPVTVWKHRFEGLLIVLVLIALLIGAFGHRIPDTVQGVAMIARMLDNLRPQLLAAALIGAVIMALFGLRWLASGAAIVCIIALITILMDYRARATQPAIVNPAAAHSEPFEVLWFNALKENNVSPAYLASELRYSGADLIVIAEALPAIDAAVMLSDVYPYRAGCETAQRCELLILSRAPLGPVTFEDTVFGPQRLARFFVNRPNGPDPVVVAMHRTKAWYTGLTGGEDEWSDVVLGGRRDHPLVVVGDFNATPWSRRMAHLADFHNLQSAVRPVATWPANAGRFGFAIDHILTRGGARIESLTPWGASLGSNHRGLRASISLSVSQE